MSEPKRKLVTPEDLRPVEMAPGVIRNTIAYNDEIMLCVFTLKAGSVMPVHSHAFSQNGYIISGRLKFTAGAAREFVAGPGAGYAFDPDEAHGAEVLEDATVIECFSPMRPDYAF